MSRDKSETVIVGHRSADPRKVLIVFGDMLTFSGNRVRGNEILRKLLSVSIWKTSQVPKQLLLPASAVFYQSAVGIVATATITTISRNNQTSHNLLPGFPMELFPVTFHLEKVDIFERPRNIRDLVTKLDFVSNKKYWGHSFRNSPRLISAADFELLAVRDGADEVSRRHTA